LPTFGILIFKSFQISGEKIEKNEMGEVCSAYGGVKRYIWGFGVEI
jgi:hypothetical protein